MILLLLFIVYSDSRLGSRQLSQKLTFHIHMCTCSLHATHKHTHTRLLHPQVVLEANPKLLNFVEGHGSAHTCTQHKQHIHCSHFLHTMQVVLEANPKLLIFVEGVERNACVQPGENCWWGGHIAGHAKVSYHGALNRFVVVVV